MTTTHDLTTLDRSDSPSDSPPAAPSASRPARQAGLFRAFWRWHFYASILVIPIFALLSVTGLIMLFKWQIDPIQEPAMTFSPPAYGATVPLDTQQRAVLEGNPGATVTAVQTTSGDRSTIFTIDREDGSTVNVYVNPYTAKVLGTRDPTTLISDMATVAHGNIIFGSTSEVTLFTDPITGEDFTIGSIGDRIIETAACWSIIMALTGYYLFFRGRAARAARRVKAVAGAATRSRHALVGAVAGVGILFIVVSGLPWTGLWGSAVQKYATGTPFALWGDDPGASSRLSEVIDNAGSTSAPPPWAEGAAPLPSSDPHAGHTGTGSTPAEGPRAIGLDAAVQAATDDGVPLPVYITMPDGPEGVYSVMSDMWHDKDSAAYTDVSKERVVHIDQYSGAVAGRYAYAEYPAAAKLVSQGIAIHEGQRLGTLNFWASAAFCVGLLFLCVTGPLMWWRRRKEGLGAPRGSLPVRARPWLAVVLVVLGVAMPLFGLTLVIVLLVDWLVIRRSDRLRSVFSTTA